MFVWQESCPVTNQSRYWLTAVITNENIWIIDLPSMFPLVWMKGKNRILESQHKYSKNRQKQTRSWCVRRSDTSTVNSLFISPRIIHREASNFQSLITCMAVLWNKVLLRAVSPSSTSICLALVHANEAHTQVRQARKGPNWYIWWLQCLEYFLHWSHTHEYWT